MNKEEVNQVLVKAAENGDLESMKEALAAGADVDYELGAPLRFAVEKNHVDCVKLLLENFAFPEFSDHVNWRPLHSAAYYGHVECLKLLINAGVDLDAEADVGFAWDEGATAWSLALDRGHGECAYLLAAAGAEVGSGFKDGTAMCNSISSNEPSDLRVLIAAGANVNGCVPAGYGCCTFIEYAAKHGYDDALMTLLDAGAVVDGLALLYAVENKKTKTAKILINAGADVNAAWRTGKTALMCAVTKKMVTIVKMLITHGADINARDNDNKSALDIAIEKGDEKCIAILKAAGAEASSETNMTNS